MATTVSCNWRPRPNIPGRSGDTFGPDVYSVRMFLQFFHLTVWRIFGFPAVFPTFSTAYQLSWQAVYISTRVKSSRLFYNVKYNNVLRRTLLLPVNFSQTLEDSGTPTGSSTYIHTCWGHTFLERPVLDRTSQPYIGSMESPSDGQNEQRLLSSATSIEPILQR